MSEKNVDCENEMELIGQAPCNTAHVEPLWCSMGPETVGKLAPQRMAPYDVPPRKPLRPHLQALGTFGHVQNSSVHIAEYVENKAEKSVFNPSVRRQRDMSKLRPWQGVKCFSKTPLSVGLDYKGCNDEKASQDQLTKRKTGYDFGRATWLSN